ncbi:hypothetical protein HMPREF1977_1668 [Capnocytophaga ochracea F0287]|uniref:Uncharacterized protein n=1 Tax=Capnocytophaga ochracea F0287 TaxID=873517 RepID=E4MTF8_CAPOC|nr:hypothetical protein HMPREF1977_1668 [Capnocytophaga ochracea F0287]EJF45235.1 hypothetical protein HMPREF1319_0134 [Capnocytophaga ochracea str. Holt 25]
MFFREGEITKNILNITNVLLKFSLFYMQFIVLKRFITLFLS